MGGLGLAFETWATHSSLEVEAYFRPEGSWAFGPPKVMKNVSVLWKRNPSPLSSRPERTGISYFALLATSTCAALRRESRMQILNATGLHRKSGGAQWRDLRFGGSFLGMLFSTERRLVILPGHSRPRPASIGAQT